MDLNKDLLGQMLTKGNLVTLDKLFKLQAECSYTLFVGRSVGFEFQYRFLFYSLTENQHPFHAQYVNNQMLVGFIVDL
jgi:hypothetical protein